MAVHYPLVGAPSYALTNGPQVFRTFTPTSQADMVERIVAALLDAYHPAAQPYGWTLDSSITRGHRLLLTSPQTFTAYLDVYWTPSPGLGRNPVNLKFSSATGSGAVGFEQRLDFQEGCQYQIVANPAGYFISRPGIVYALAGSNCCGGIPFVDSGCGFGADQITEIWFSFADALNGLGDVSFHELSPRAALDIGGGGTLGGLFGPGQQGNYNGTIVSGLSPGIGGIGTPQILRISSAGTDVPSGSHALWYDGKPILYPAFVGWGDSSSSLLKIRGQIYDAMVRSKAYAMDATESWDTFDWINFTDQYYFGSLWLITGESAPAGGSLPIVNVAY